MRIDKTGTLAPLLAQVLALSFSAAANVEAADYYSRNGHEAPTAAWAMGDAAIAEHGDELAYDYFGTQKLSPEFGCVDVVLGSISLDPHAWDGLTLGDARLIEIRAR